MLELKGHLSIDKIDHFEVEGEPDTYRGTSYSPLMFNGASKVGALEAIIKQHLPLVRIKPIQVRITVEEIV